jgi:hypothetical protein
MRTGLCHSLAAIALTLSTTRAQTVSPEHFSSADGDSYSALPFGTSNPTGWRYQQVHDDLKGKKLTLRGLAFRRDNATAEPYMSFSLRMTVVLSTSATTSATMSTTFSSNHGTSTQTVLSGKQIDFKATRSSFLPAPFDYAIAFDQPYSFDGTSNGLCWEVQISQQINLQTSVYFDTVVSTSTSPPANTGTYGTACLHSTQRTAVSAAGSSSMDWPNSNGTLYLTGYNLAMSSVAIGVFGFSRTLYGPIPLPFLFPGSPNQYSGPCYLNASLDFMLPTGSDQNGYAQASFPVPLATSMNGFTLRAQLLAIDNATKAAIPLIGSNGVEYNFLAPYSLAQMSNCYASSTLAPTGTMTANNGLVTQLR